MGRELVGEKKIKVNAPQKLRGKQREREKSGGVRQGKYANELEAEIEGK